MCKIGSYQIPHTQKCCFFLPLKKGLTLWGYFKLMFHVILVFYTLLLVIRFKQLALDGSYIIILLFLFIIIDIIMHIVLIKSTQDDNYRMMSSYYYYIIILLVLYGIVFLIFTVIKMIRDGDFFFNWAFMIQECVIGCGNFALQFYFCILVKNHISNLKSGYDPELDSLTNDSEREGENEDKKRDKKKYGGSAKDNHDNSSEDDTEDSSTSGDEDIKSDNKPGQASKETTSKKDDQEIRKVENSAIVAAEALNKM